MMSVAGGAQEVPQVLVEQGQADGVTSDTIIRKLIETLPADASTTMDDSLARRVFATD